MTEIRRQIFFGDLRLKNELHYNGDSRARRLCLELRRMISATSFSLTHSLSPPWIQPPSPHYLTLPLSLTLVVSFSWSFSLFHLSFFDSFVSIFGRTFSLCKFRSKFRSLLFSNVNLGIQLLLDICVTIKTVKI